METIRVVVAPPIQEPRQLAEAMRACVTVARVLERYRPQTRAAGSWQYALERWALSLDSAGAESVRRSLRAVIPDINLTREQTETLDAFFTFHLNISETARYLFLHRNTLLYRLDKLKEQTGLDPRQLADAMLLRLALLFRQNN
jgi:DNA-binding PucR family transcriptional regulator